MFVIVAVSIVVAILFCLWLFAPPPPCWRCGKPAYWYLQEYIYECDECRRRYFAQHKDEDVVARRSVMDIRL